MNLSGPHQVLVTVLVGQQGDAHLMSAGMRQMVLVGPNYLIRTMDRMHHWKENQGHDLIRG